MALHRVRDTERLAMTSMDRRPRSRGSILPEVCKNFHAPRNQRAQGMPDARCIRGLVRKKRRTHTSIQGSGGDPTFPAQWLYGLYRALPGDRACLTPSPANMAARARLG